MRLTKLQKDAFVQAVMRDIPTEKFKDEAKNLVQKIAISQCPPEIQKLWKNSVLRSFLLTRNIRIGSYEDFDSIAYVVWEGGYGSEEMTIRKHPEVVALVQKAEKQKESLENMRLKLEAAMASVSTLKQAQELLPEFIEYLPKENGVGTKYAPAVIANLSADLMALGWPKGKAKEAATT